MARWCLLSLGDDRVLKSIKNGLAMGADRALHLTGPEFHGSDAHVVATAIQRAIADQAFDVVLTGVQSDDLAFGQTGTILAELLGWAHATIVMEIAVNPEGKTVQVKRELESNLFEKVEIPLPAVLAIQSGINQPRYATLKGIMQAKKKEIKTLLFAGSAHAVGRRWTGRFESGPPKAFVPREEEKDRADRRRTGRSSEAAHGEASKGSQGVVIDDLFD